MRLNLGCSDDLRGGEWINVDMAPPDNLLVSPGQKVNFERADLNKPWPWPKSSVDEIYAADIFEHLENRIFTMNQAWLVLKPGGLLTMECPDAAKGAGQWQDPTHVSPWTPNGLQYFADGSPAHKRFAAAYGITARFKVLSVAERMYRESIDDGRGSWSEAYPGVIAEVFKFTAILEAIKP